MGLACCGLGGEKRSGGCRGICSSSNEAVGGPGLLLGRGTWRGDARPLPSGVASAPRRRRGSPKPDCPKDEGGGDAYAPKGLWRLSGGFEPERSRAAPSAGDAKRLGARDMWLAFGTDAQRCLALVGVVAVF